MKNLLLLTTICLFISATSFCQIILTDVGTTVRGYSGDGHPAIDAELNQPWGINLDDNGNLYICDNNNCIRKVSPGYGGIITTIAGNGTGGYSGDGYLGIYAQLSVPVDVVVDRYGNIYIADEGNNVIRKVTPTDTITTIAGTGIAGYNGDSILATTAQLNIPSGICVDSIGNIYIADEFNYRIRKVDTSGIITTIAGTGIPGYSPDNSKADTSKLNLPYSIRIDKSGNLFLADSVRIRKINSAGIITTIAGNGIYGYSGDSGLAIAAEIGGGPFALDSFGNLYIADDASYRIREVNTAGIIYNVAGNGTDGYSGDNGPPLLAKLSIPEGVAISNSGDIYISDNANNCIRLVTSHPLSVNNILNNMHKVSIYPNPSNGAFILMISSDVKEHANVTICNVLGEMLQEFSATTNQHVNVQLNVPTGVYYLSTTTAQQHLTEKIIIH